MPNVKREDHTVAELEAILADAKRELAEALAVYGEGSREHREAETVLGLYQRRLDDALAAKERRENDEKRSPQEIVDRVMGA